VTRRSTSTTPVKHATAKAHATPKPAVSTTRALKPIAHIKHIAPATAAIPDFFPAPAAAGHESSVDNGSWVWRLLVLLVALVLLAGSLVSSDVVAHAGFGRARAASVRIGLAVAGLAVVGGYVIVLLLSSQSQ
jgi:hypothetical protein